MISCSFGMNNIHKFHECLAYCWWGVPAFGIGPWDHYSFDWSILLALGFEIVLEILECFLIEQIFRIEHIQKLKNPARYFTERIRTYSLLNIIIGNIIIGKQIRSGDMVGWLDLNLS